MVAVIYVGGMGPSAPPALPAEPIVRIAADSGLDLAVASGADVDLVVGDLDSVSVDALAAARVRNVEVRASPADKDETDLELAIACAEALGASQLVVIGGGGGRLDHLLGVLAALAGAARRGLDVAAYPGDDLMWLVAPGVRLELSIQPGRTVSLVPVGGSATGVTASGLVWPLADATLNPYEGLGVSNRAEAPTVAVEVADGVVAVIVPDLAAEGRHAATRAAGADADAPDVGGPVTAPDDVPCPTQAAFRRDHPSNPAQSTDAVPPTRPIPSGER